MASTNSSTSWIGILALLVLVGVVVYFVTREADDDELEIDIGMAREVPVSVAA